MESERLSRLQRLLAEAGSAGLDGLALVPGPNLFYLTGLSFHLSERPIVALLFTDRPPLLILPALEAGKAERLAGGWRAFAYSDEEGYDTVFQNAVAMLGLTGGLVGVEALRARFLEVSLLERYIPAARLAPAEDVLARLRMCKEPAELDAMRRAVAVTEAALERTMDSVQAGMTERAIATALKIELLRAGADGVSFEPIVVAGPNAALPHATPGERPIQAGEPIVVDCGAMVDGYAADITRTFSIGPLTGEMARVYRVVQAANEAGRAAVRPDVPAEAVDRAARAVIEAAGYGPQFVHRTGHGLGLEIHEPPYIVAGNRQPLEPGMTFTVEPGIYLPGVGGVRIEDDVVVTESGGESLTTFPRRCDALLRRGTPNETK